MARVMFPLLLAFATAQGAAPTLEKPTDDWDVMPLDKSVPSLKAHLQSAFDGGKADIRLYVVRTEVTLEAQVEEWAAALEKHMGLKRVVREGVLGDAKCTVIDLKNKLAHVTSWVTKRGDTMYTLHVIREGSAVDDEDVEAEIEQVRRAITLPKPVVKPQPEKEAAPEVSPRAEIKFEFWKLIVAKPAGLERVTSLDNSETRNNVILKLQAQRQQGFLMIRVYARTKQKARRLADLHADRRKHVERTYGGKFLERKSRWKPPLTKKILRLEGTGKRKVSEQRYWHVVDCRNDRQYEIDILATGAWDDEIADFLKNFRPVKQVK